MGWTLGSVAALGIVVAAESAGHAVPARETTTSTRVQASEQWCHPHENTARILFKPAPNAIHRDWAGDSYIGTSWGLKPKQMIRAGSFAFVKGDLYSPRGGLTNKEVYVLASEWSCD